jgi:hypothetical protein
MTNGTDRLDRIERILEDTAKRQEDTAKRQEEAAKRQEDAANRQDQFSERMDRISQRMDRFSEGMIEVRGMLQEMAARQQYHDDAFERFDADMKLIKEAQAIDGEHIRALARIAELHNQRFDHLEGGEIN